MFYVGDGHPVSARHGLKEENQNVLMRMTATHVALHCTHAFIFW